MRSSNIQEYERWFAACPAFKGNPLSALPPAYREWILSAPVLVLDKAGDETSFTDPNVSRVKTAAPSRLRSSQRGSVLLEFALCIPLLLVIVLGSMDMLFAIKAKSAVDYVAEQSARCIVTHGCDPATIAASNAAGLGLNPADLIVSIDAGAATATVVYTFHPFGPVFPQITMKSTASGAQ